MDICAQMALGPIYGYSYFFLLVIFGSFCLLNLTVATVGQTVINPKPYTLDPKTQTLDPRP
jgi:hypothetical protein